MVGFISSLTLQPPFASWKLNWIFSNIISTAGRQFYDWQRVNPYVKLKPWTTAKFLRSTMKKLRKLSFEKSIEGNVSISGANIKRHRLEVHLIKQIRTVAMDPEFTDSYSFLSQSVRVSSSNWFIIYWRIFYKLFLEKYILISAFTIFSFKFPTRSHHDNISYSCVLKSHIKISEGDKQRWTFIILINYNIFSRIYEVTKQNVPKKFSVVN